MGKLIVLEGIDGSGKSTQYQLLCGHLEKRAQFSPSLLSPVRKALAPFLRCTCRASSAATQGL